VLRVVVQVGGVTVAQTTVASTSNWTTVTLPFVQSSTGFTQVFVQSTAATRAFDAQHFAIG
jgi:hypothetical protein